MFKYSKLLIFQFISKRNKSELGTLELDTFNPDYLIRISNVDTFNFLLNPLLVEKNQKPVFQN